MTERQYGYKITIEPLQEFGERWTIHAENVSIQTEDTPIGLGLRYIITIDGHTRIERSRPT